MAQSPEVLRGREDVLRRLRGLLGVVSAGAKRGGVITGPSGSGRTALLRWFQRIATDEGYHVILVKVPASFAQSPVHPADGVIEELSSLGNQSTLDVADPAQMQRPWPARLVDALERAGDQTRPIAILIDDIDAASAFGCDGLAGGVRAANRPILLLVTTRPDHSTTLQASGDLWVEHFSLGPLGVQATQQLAADSLGGPPLPSLVELLHDRSAGNPLLAKEILRFWSEEQRLLSEGGFWALRESPPDDVSTPAEDFIHARLLTLSDEELETLLVLTLIGRPLNFRQLTMLTTRSADSAISQLIRLERAGLVAEVSSSFTITNQRVGSRVLAIVPATLRRWWHTRIAQYLFEERRLTGKGAPSELASHMIASLAEPNGVIGIISEAAQEAENVRNHLEAARWYRHLRVRVTGPERRTALIREAVASMYFSPETAIELFTVVIDADTTTDPEVALHRAVAWRRLGRFAEALADVDSCLNSAGPPLRDEALHAKAVLHAIMGDTSIAESMLAELADRAAGTPIVAKALGHLAQIRFCGGQLEGSMRLMRDALSTCVDEDYAQYLYPNLAWIRTLAGEWQAAESTYIAAERTATAQNDIWNLAHLFGGHAKLCSLRGSTAEALDLSTSALALAGKIGNPGASTDAIASRVFVLLECGDPHAAITLWNGRSFADVGASEPRELSFSLVTVGETYLMLGDIAEARRCWQIARDNLNTARVWVEAVDRLEAQIELADGNPLAAVGIVRPWLLAPGKVVFEHARLLEIAAQAYLASRDRISAKERAGEALAIYEQLGAKLRAQRVRTWMEKKLRGPGRPRMRLPGGLTEREHEVLRYVITGKTNRDIARALTVSVSTVNKHVERIISKAGVTRRTELVAYAQRLHASVGASA